MMNQNTGGFEPILDLKPIAKEVRGIQLDPETYNGMPTLAVEEIVEIKGIKFVVKHIKTNGKLSLKMLRLGNSNG